ncbi:glutamate decarboxylase [Salix suchowensis]|nr:glutamate decarboxylase [Salix suchowensis]
MAATCQSTLSPPTEYLRNLHIRSSTMKPHWTAILVESSFVKEANALIMENINKNAVDLDEYPATQNIHNRCVSMSIRQSLEGSEGEQSFGNSHAGSSEGLMLGGLALKKRWQEGRKAAGKDYFHPNINAIQFIDENTIGVVVILGSTYTGHFENVQEMSDLLTELHNNTGLDIPIHVDAASGGFFAPFAYPSYKYTQAWAGCFGRMKACYTRTSFSNFVRPVLPRPAHPYSRTIRLSWKHRTLVHAEFLQTGCTYNFPDVQLPQSWCRRISKIAIKGLRNARLLSRALERTYFKVLSNIHKPAIANGSQSEEKGDNPELYQRGLPVVSFRSKGWIVPNYNGPKGADDVEILRIVVRETLSEDLVERLVVDILEITESLMSAFHSTRLSTRSAYPPSGSAGAAAMMEAATSSKGSHQPDAEHGRPDQTNFGSSDNAEQQEQSTFSRQC